MQHATKALEVGPNSVEMREVRLACNEEMGDVDAVYGDLRYVSCAHSEGDGLTQ